MEWLPLLVGLVALLFLLGRGLPTGTWLLIVRVALAFIVVVLGLERAGLWPQGWRTR